MKGSFVVSLDFELAWGTRGRPAAKYMKPFLAGTRRAIQGLLDLSARYDVPMTWAVVGAMFLRQENGKRHEWLCETKLDDVPTGNARSHPEWYAEDVLPWLIEHPVEQELACHSFSHLYVEPSDEGRERLRQDLRKFRELWKEWGLEQPTTFIFPKAKMAHFDVLVEEGFRCIRGPESGWFETLPGQLLPAAFRLIDGKCGCAPRVATLGKHPSGLSVVPSSQFYSPFYSVGKWVSVEARVRKAVKGLEEAVRRKAVYHLWTHPFNLGVRTEELLRGLQEIFRTAAEMREKGLLETVSMGQAAQRI